MSQFPVRSYQAFWIARTQPPSTCRRKAAEIDTRSFFSLPGPGWVLHPSGQAGVGRALCDQIPNWTHLYSELDDYT
jgi:hypothetical protein